MQTWREPAAQYLPRSRALLAVEALAPVRATVRERAACIGQQRACVRATDLSPGRLSNRTLGHSHACAHARTCNTVASRGCTCSELAPRPSAGNGSVRLRAGTPAAGLASGGRCGEGGAEPSAGSPCRLCCASCADGTALRSETAASATDGAGRVRSEGLSSSTGRMVLVTAMSIAKRTHTIMARTLTCRSAPLSCMCRRTGAISAPAAYHLASLILHAHAHLDVATAVRIVGSMGEREGGGRAVLPVTRAAVWAVLPVISAAFVAVPPQGTRSPSARLSGLPVLRHGTLGLPGSGCAAATRPRAGGVGRLCATGGNGGSAAERPASPPLPPLPGLPTVEIEYCTGCRWLLRAAWLAQVQYASALAARPQAGSVVRWAVASLALPLFTLTPVQELLTTFEGDIARVSLMPSSGRGGGVFDIR